MKTPSPSAFPLYRSILLGIFITTARAAAQTRPTDPLTLLQNRPTPATEPRPADPIESQRRRLMNPQDDDPAARDAALAGTQRLARTLTNAQVRDAIKQAADHLLLAVVPARGQHVAISTADQRPWIDFAGDQSVGVLALAAQALLEAGRVTGDPRLRPFSPELTPLLQALLDADTRQTYSAALQASALALLPPRPEVVKTLERIRNQLVRGMREDGGYGYSLNHTTYWDNSNTQYAVLGLWAIADMGCETPNKFWMTQDLHWRECQAPAGGWAYRTPEAGFVPDGKMLEGLPTASLTAAGLASLFVTLDHLNGGMRERSQDRALRAGLTAFSKDFSDNLPALGTDLYYAYSVQRVGVASGLKYVDHANWFREGAAALLSSRKADGSWTYGYSPILGSAYAILFLTHGGAPVIFNKLQYPGPWDASPRDDANLTRRISHTLEVSLNWQIVSLDTDPVDWLDAPVLLITGHGDPHFTDEDLVRLAAYVHAGGIVFSSADENDEAFTAAIQKYATQATGGTYAMRPLPAEHPLFTLYRKVKNPPGLRGISNGARELWIHSPVDMSSSWQHLAYSVKEHWDIPLNLYLYATGRERPRDRLDSLAVEVPALPAHAVVSLARLSYEGNADPEPGAWLRFGRVLKRDMNVQMNLHTVEISNLGGSGCTLAHLTGTEAFTLPDASVAALKAFLKKGGTLLADATGGGDAFGQSFLALAKKLAPESQIEILPMSSPVFDGSLPDTLPIDWGHAEYRKGAGVSRSGSGRPEIWGWKVQGRYAILFSPLDITSGLLGTQTWGIAGYSPPFAQAIARNLVMYARSLSLPAGPATTTAPAGH